MTSGLRATILGSGSSGGVPRPGGSDGHGDWGLCDPNEPRNRRSRCSLLVEKAHPEHGFDPAHVTSILVDTSPDMRTQLLDAGCTHLDAVLFTHDHADQSHGIDDLRVLAIANRSRVPVWLDEDTSGILAKRFSYCFEQQKGSPYPAILERFDIPAAGEVFSISGPAGDIDVTSFLQLHGSVNSLGFRFDNIAYSSDVVDLPDASFEMLQGLDVWIVDALQEKPHGSHAHLEKTLEWIERVQPKHAILTNLHVTMDYSTLKKRLPAHIEPAYDGMRLIEK